MGNLTLCCLSGISSFRKYLAHLYWVLGTQRRAKQIFFLKSLSLWKYLGKLKNRNRVMGVIGELHRAMGRDPVWGGIREDFLEEVTQQRPEG